MIKYKTKTFLFSLGIFLTISISSWALYLPYYYTLNAVPDGINERIYLLLVEYTGSVFHTSNLMVGGIQTGATCHNFTIIEAQDPDQLPNNLYSCRPGNLPELGIDIPELSAKDPEAGIKAIIAINRNEGNANFIRAGNGGMARVTCNQDNSSCTSTDTDAMIDQGLIWGGGLIAPFVTHMGTVSHVFDPGPGP